MLVKFSFDVSADFFETNNGRVMSGSGRDTVTHGGGGIENGTCDVGKPLSIVTFVTPAHPRNLGKHFSFMMFLTPFQAGDLGKPLSPVTFVTPFQPRDLSEHLSFVTLMASPHLRDVGTPLSLVPSVTPRQFRDWESFSASWRP